MAKLILGRLAILGELSPTTDKLLRNATADASLYLNKTVVSASIAILRWHHPTLT